MEETNRPKTIHVTLMERDAWEAMLNRFESLAALLARCRTLTQGCKWVPNAEAIRILGVERSTIARWRMQNLVRFARVGGRIFYPLMELLQWRLQGRHSAHREAFTQTEGGI